MNDSQEPAPKSRKRCFVVMGFGIKTDFATGRKLDLNKSYRLLIKPVVLEKGLECIRADEIPHSGSIDFRMYQELLDADVVIADLSTANVNAFYELGIRHALRPRTTIVVSEDKLAYPFDLNHIKITSYTHLGDAIDYEEVERFRHTLGETLQAVLDEEEPDSPVYTYLRQLIPPSLRAETAKAVDHIEHTLEKAKEHEAVREEQRSGEPDSEKTLSLLTEQGEQAIRKKEYALAKMFFTSALQFGKTGETKNIVSNDHYLIHRLALATYKAEEPEPVAALKLAIEILERLDLGHTNDPETVALAGAIEKKLYETGEGDQHLANAILYYERGYFLLNNRYNGINLAFLLSCRAGSSLCETKEDRIADTIYSNRARKRVLELCERDWNEIMNRENRKALKAVSTDSIDFFDNQSFSENEQKFWILVNKAEAYFGLGNMAAYVEARAEAEATEHDDWMMKGFSDQVELLGKVINANSNLMDGAVPK